VLDQLGIWAALEWYAAQVAQRSGMGCGCEIAPAAATLDLDPDRSIMLFRIVQEAMTNIQRHAGANRIMLQARLADGVLAVSIEDDGCGIAAGEVPARQASWGILGMQERSHSLGGTLHVAPRPGGGTVVTLQIPMDPHHAA
jgi:two-component system sensor histidine kinase UhpB